MHWLVREILGRTTRRITRIWFRKFERATTRCREVQHRVLFDKLKRNQSSDFGRAHRFDQIHSVADFRKHVPVTDYSYFEPYIERVKRGELSAMFGPKTKLHMFATTSGTTATPKFIPVTDHFLKDYRFGWMLWGIRTYDMHYAIYRLKVVQLSGDWQQSHTEAGIPCGSISGFTMQSQCRIVRERYCVPTPLMKIQDASAKYYAALRFSLPWSVGMATAANPSTLINLARLGDAEKENLVRDLADGTLADRFEIPAEVRASVEPLTKLRHPDRARELERVIAETGHLYPKDYWPALQVVSNWTGGSMGAYLRRYPEYWGNIPVRDIGLIASEGRMTIPVEDGTRAGVLDVLHQFFEFVPEAEIDSDQPTVLEAHELKEGERYYILLTTSSGLYRYNIHDLVRCVGSYNGTPMLEFLNKGSHFSSITGEKLSEFQVCRAVEQSLREFDLCLTAYTLAPCWADPPHYSLLVEECDLSNASIAAGLADTVDRSLMEQNVEYESKRDTHRLGPVTVKVLPTGTWDRFIRDRLTKRGASSEQYKHPSLSSDLDFIRQFRVVREVLPGTPSPDRKLA
jgi:hypothetical protein